MAAIAGTYYQVVGSSVMRVRQVAAQNCMYAKPASYLCNFFSVLLGYPKRFFIIFYIKAKIILFFVINSMNI